MVYGSTDVDEQVVLTSLDPPDLTALERFWDLLSAESIHRRYLSPIQRFDQCRPDRLMDIDHFDREAIAALWRGRIVGLAEYGRTSEAQVADVAVVVADCWHRQGVATRLLTLLTQRALAAGIIAFHVSVLENNLPGLGLLNSLAPARRRATSAGVREAIVALQLP